MTRRCAITDVSSVCIKRPARFPTVTWRFSIVQHAMSLLEVDENYLVVVPPCLCSVCTGGISIIGSLVLGLSVREYRGQKLTSTRSTSTPIQSSSPCHTSKSQPLWSRVWYPSNPPSAANRAQHAQQGSSITPSSRQPPLNRVSSQKYPYEFGTCWNHVQPCNCRGLFHAHAPQGLPPTVFNSSTTLTLNGPSGRGMKIKRKSYRIIHTTTNNRQ